MMTATPTRNSCTILVIDDDERIRILLAEFLHANGYAALTAPNGYEGLGLLERHPEIAAVILDWSMPVMNGAAFLHALPRSTWHQNVPVIVVSADPPSGRGDVRSVVRKPFQIDQLLRELQDCLRAPEPS